MQLLLKEWVVLVVVLVALKILVPASDAKKAVDKFAYDASIKVAVQ